jgi:predicted DNA-binding transcriptional regulator AlpA
LTHSRYATLLTRSSTLESVHHLVGITEIAEMLGVSRQRVDQLASGEGFPSPEAELAAGRVWAREAVEKWARATGREIVKDHR